MRRRCWLLIKMIWILWTLSRPQRISAQLSFPSPLNPNSTSNVIPSPPTLFLQRFKSRFLPVLKTEMAGNIIPAIATTNAIVAGLCILQAHHVLSNNLNDARMVFISRRPEHAFIAEELKPPNPHCAVCGVLRAELQCPPDETTLQDVPPPKPFFTAAAQLDAERR